MSAMPTQIPGWEPSHADVPGWEPVGAASPAHIDGWEPVHESTAKPGDFDAAIRGDQRGVMQRMDDASKAMAPGEFTLNPIKQFSQAVNRGAAGINALKTQPDVPIEQLYAMATQEPSDQHFQQVADELAKRTTKSGPIASTIKSAAGMAAEPEYSPQVHAAAAIARRGWVNLTPQEKQQFHRLMLPAVGYAPQPSSELMQTESTKLGTVGAAAESFGRGVSGTGQLLGININSSDPNVAREQVGVAGRAAAEHPIVSTVGGLAGSMVDPGMRAGGGAVNKVLAPVIGEAKGVLGAADIARKAGTSVPRAVVGELAKSSVSNAAFGGGITAADQILHGNVDPETILEETLKQAALGPVFHSTLGLLTEKFGQVNAERAAVKVVSEKYGVDAETAKQIISDTQANAESIEQGNKEVATLVQKQKAEGLIKETLSAQESSAAQPAPTVSDPAAPTEAVTPVAVKPAESEAPNASNVRENSGQSDKAGSATKEGEANRGGNVQQETERQPVNVKTEQQSGQVGLPQGPGAANPQGKGEFEAAKPEALNKAAVKAKRNELGLPPSPEKETIHNSDAVDKAVQRYIAEPDHTDGLVAELLEKPRIVTSDEHFDLLVKYRSLLNERTRLEQIRNESTGDPPTHAKAVKDIEDVDRQIHDVATANEKGGSHVGRSLQSFKAALNEGLTLAEAKANLAYEKGGPLTPEEETHWEGVWKQLQEAKKKLAAYEESDTAKGRTRKLATVHDETVKDVEKTKYRESVKGQKRDLPAEKQSILDRIKERAADGDSPTELKNLIRKLHRLVISEGVTDREKAVDAVHDLIKKIVPELNRNEVMDLMSGYGDFKALSKDAVSVTQREHRGELQQLAKLRDLMEKSMALKSGMERAEPTAEQRKLTKQVNDLMKKLGIRVTDPEKQIKSTLDAMKTRWKNAIADMADEIAAGKKLVREKGSIPLDAEAEALKAQYQEAKAEYDKVFPKEALTHAQQIENAIKSEERQLAAYEKQLADGTVVRPDKPALTSPELDAIRAKKEAAQERVKLLRDLIGSDAASERRIRELQERLDAINEKIAKGDITRKGAAGEGSPEVEAIKRQIKLASDTLNRLRAEAEPKNPSVPGMSGLRMGDIEQKVEAARNNRIKQLEESIANINKRIAARDVGQKPSQPGFESPEILALTRQRDLATKTLNRIRTEVNQKPQQQVDAESRQRRIEQLEKTIAKAQERIAKGDVNPKQGPPKYEGADIEALKTQAGTLADTIAKIRGEQTPQKTKEEIALQATTTRLANRLGELAEKMVTQDFAPASPKKPIKLDMNALKLRAEVKKFQEAFKKGQEQYRLAHRTPGEKLKDRTTVLLGLQKAWKLGGDLSYVLNQGKWLITTAPIKAMARMADLVKAGKSDDYGRQKDIELTEGPKSAEYKEAGLNFISDTHPSETFLGELVKKLPGFSHVERAQKTWVNLVMADVYDKLTSPGMTMAEKKNVAKLVNDMAQRTTFGKYEHLSGPLSTVLLSPRSVASRIKMEVINPLKVIAPSSLTGMTAKTRLAYARVYGQYIAGTALVYALSSALGGKREDDPRSSNFGKVKFGHTWYDPLSGLAQYIALTAKLATGHTKTGSGLVVPNRGPDVPQGVDKGDELIYKFGRSRASPMVGLAMDMFKGSHYDGTPVTAGSMAKEAFVPLGIQNIIDVANSGDGIPQDVTMGVLSFLGERVNAYKQNPKSLSIDQLRDPQAKDAELGAIKTAQRAGEISIGDAKNRIAQSKLPDDKAKIINQMSPAQAVAALELNAGLAGQKHLGPYTYKESVRRKIIDSDKLTPKERADLLSRLAKTK